MIRVRFKAMSCLSLAACLLVGNAGFAEDFPIVSGDYLGQEPPDSVPVVFAPGLVSVEGRYEYGLALSPDGNEIFFTAEGPGEGLTVMRRVDGAWSRPEAANLTGQGLWEFEAFYTVDGYKVFFSVSQGERRSRIWFSERDSTGWSKGELLDSPVNDKDVFWATFTSDGTMYYTDIGARKICRSKPVDGNYRQTEETGIPFGGHPFVSPDGSFMLFNGKGDLWVAFRQSDETWSEPQLLEDPISSEFTESCPSLSPDGKYIFFSRYDEPEEKSNIYWVSSDIIERIKRACLK